MRCLIIEDEPLAREVVEGYIDDVPDLECVQSFANPIQAADFMRQHSDAFDFLILDVNMPKIKGTEFLKTLDQQPLVIFVTAYSEYAVESYDFNTVDYLTKPVAFHRFLKAIEKMRQRLSEPTNEVPDKSDFLFVKEKDTYLKISFEEIVWVEGMADYVKLKLPHRQHVIHSSMKAMMEKLPSEFIRVHQSFIVNSSRIEALRGNRLIIGEDEIPIGRTYKGRLLELFKM